MNEVELKKLAEWLRIEFWFKPHKDSNQLDMLEDKMIENKKVKIIITKFEITILYQCYELMSDMEMPLLTSGTGKTKNEARLNAILNYVEGVK